MDAVFKDRTGEAEAARRAEIEREILTTRAGTARSEGSDSGVSRRLVATSKADEI